MGPWKVPFFVEILSRNNKIKAMSGTKTFNFGIPAFKEASGRITCPMAEKCAKGCYASKGFFRMPNVKNSYQTRYELTKLESFADIMAIEIKRKKAKRIRIHDSGDFYSTEYLKKWCDIANRFPLTKFYFYTKSVSMIKSHVLPSNMVPIFSYGGKQDALINPKKDRHARVFNSESELKAAGYVDASKDDAKSLGKSKRIGLLFRGNLKESFA